jgi:hypothetical protein
MVERADESSSRPIVENGTVAIQLPVSRIVLTAVAAIVVLIGMLALVMGLNRPDPAAPANPNLDRRARLNEWTPVLDAKVVPLAWDDTHPAHNWSQHPHRIVVDCANEAFLSVGRTHAADYSLQCTIGRSNWQQNSGAAGLFLGYQPIVNLEGHLGRRCLVVSVVSDDEQGKFQHFLRLETWDLMDVANSPHPSSQVVTLSAVVVPKPGAQNLLEVEIRHGSLTSIKWQSAEYSDLVQEGRFPIVATIGEESQLGVMNCLGSATFSDVRFKLLDNIPQPAKEAP